MEYYNGGPRAGTLLYLTEMLSKSPTPPVTLCTIPSAPFIFDQPALQGWVPGGLSQAVVYTT